MLWCSKMLQKINQKYDKTPKFNTRNTHQYQLFNSVNNFQLQQHATVSGHLAHAMCLWRWWFISHVIVYLLFNICSCRLQPESKLLVTSQRECIADHHLNACKNSVGILIFQKEEHGDYRSTFYFISKKWSTSGVKIRSNLINLIQD